MQLNFAISSNIEYYKTTTQIIVPSILKLGYDTANIWMFIGDSDSQLSPLPTQYNINSFLVPVRAFEFTAAIAIIDHFDTEEKYWFMIHDTCYLGEEFRRKLETFNLNDDLLPLNKEGQNNIGFCTTQHIKDQKDFLDKYRGFSNNDLYALKKLIIREEGQFFVKADRHLGCRALLDFDSPDDTTFGTTGRKLEYWPCLDLYKIKNNFGGKNRYGLQL